MALKKVPSRFFPPGILIDLVNRPPKGNSYEGFKIIPIFSRFNPIFMRLQSTPVLTVSIDVVFILSMSLTAIQMAISIQTS